MSENQKQDAEQQQGASETADRELRLEEMDDVTGGAIVVHDVRRTNEQNDK